MGIDLNELLVFAKVAEKQSFTEAARDLGLPKATVSRKVRDLEERLGTRLLARTTRRVAPTEAGQILQDYCNRIAQEVEDAEAAVSRMQSAPRGNLRVSAPYTLGLAWLAPISAEFLALHPGIRLNLELSNSRVDLVGQGYDLAIRVGALDDSSHASRPLGRIVQRLYASPDYLDAHGRPSRPEELSEYDTLSLALNVRSDRVMWSLSKKTEQVQVAVRPLMVSNDPATLKAPLVAGRGIGLMGESFCADEVKQGLLEVVLPGWTGPVSPVSAIFPSRTGLPPKTRAFIDFIATRVDLGGSGFSAPEPGPRKTARKAGTNAGGSKSDGSKPA